MKLRGGSNESIVWYATPLHSQSVVCRAGKIARLGLIGLVHDGLAQWEEFAGRKGLREEVREVLVTLYVWYDKLVIFPDLADKEMTSLHVFEL